MPSPSTGNLTPSLHCPRCMQPFRIPRDKVGSLLRCKRCESHFRVAHDKAGGYVVRKDGAAPDPRARPPPGTVPDHFLPGRRLAPPRKGQGGRAAHHAAGRTASDGRRRHDAGQTDHAAERTGRPGRGRGSDRAGQADRPGAARQGRRCPGIRGRRRPLEREGPGRCAAGGRRRHRAGPGGLRVLPLEGECGQPRRRRPGQPRQVRRHRDRLHRRQARRRRVLLDRRGGPGASAGRAAGRQPETGRPARTRPATSTTASCSGQRTASATTSTP